MYIEFNVSYELIAEEVARLPPKPERAARQVHGGAGLRVAYGGASYLCWICCSMDCQSILHHRISTT